MAQYLQYLEDMYSSKTSERKLQYLKYNFGAFLKPDMTILELGPGLGEFLAFASEAGVNSIDVIERDEAVLERLKQNFTLNNSWLVSAENLSSIDEELRQYDCIFMLQIMEHVETKELPNLIQTLFNHLKPGGVLLVTVPNGGNPLSVVERYSDITHHNVFTENSLKQLVNMTGLSPCETTVAGYKIPTSNILNRFRRALQSLLHLLLKGVLIVNGGVSFKLFEPNITLIVKKTQ